MCSRRNRIFLSALTLLSILLHNSSLLCTARSQNVDNVTTPYYIFHHLTMKGLAFTKPITLRTVIRNVPVAPPSLDDPPTPLNGCATAAIAKPSEIPLQIRPLKVIWNN